MSIASRTVDGPSERASPARDDEWVVAALDEHAASMMSLARRHSLCADDAHEAYQRTAEIFLRRAGSVTRATVGGWLRTVIKHESMAVRAQRVTLVGESEGALEALAPAVEDAAERVERLEHLGRAAEALERLKPQEVRALVLLAEGHSYKEICAATGWSYTKVNRCLTEGRAALRARVAEIELGLECDRWAPALSALADGEASMCQLLTLRPHLRRCAGCRATLRAYREAPVQVAALVPPGVLGVPVALGGSGLLVRLHEALAAGVHERTAASAQKLQALFEATSTGKLAAVAASTVALAGGGFVAGRHLVAPAHHRAPARHAAARVVHARTAAVPAAARASTATGGSGATAAAHGSSAARARVRTASAEFTPEGGAAGPSRSGASPRARAASTAHSTAARAPAVPAPSRPAAPRHSSAPAGEFGP